MPSRPPRWSQTEPRLCPWTGRPPRAPLPPGRYPSSGRARRDPRSRWTKATVDAQELSEVQICEKEMRVAHVVDKDLRAGRCRNGLAAVPICRREGRRCSSAAEAASASSTTEASVVLIACSIVRPDFTLSCFPCDRGRRAAHLDRQSHHDHLLAEGRRAHRGTH